MGPVKLLRRGELLTDFEGRETTTATTPAATNQKKSKKINKMKKFFSFWKRKNKVDGFQDGDDVEIYSATCRIGAEPEMAPTRIELFSGLSVESPPASCLPFPLSLLRRAVG